MMRTPTRPKPSNGLDFTDLFCGAGGSSTGLVEAGWTLKLAANHSKVSIETHSANHRDADHLCEDVNKIDMRRLPRTRGLWGSPICTEISPAGGNKTPTHPDQLALMEYGAIDRSAFDRTRATAYDIIRATEVHRYDVIMCENVVEFATRWELFDWWRDGMHRLGYQSQVVSASSAHVGDDNNRRAPQYRNRLYIVFTPKGVKMPDLRPRPLCWCYICEHEVEGYQAWKNGATIGKYRDQYDYRCPNSSCRHSVVEPFTEPAASIIDWANLGTKIGDRPVPLAASTMARIQMGLDMFPDRSTVVTLNHSDHQGRAFPADAAPLPTRSTKIGEGLVVPVGGGWNQSATPTNAPFRTRMANPKGYEALVTTADPFLIEYRNHATPSSVQRPMATVTAGGNHHGLVIPYRAGTLPDSTDRPIHTISTRDSAGLLRGQRPIEDCYFRMLQPREQLLAQRFPAEYIVKGTKGEQTMQAGNAVSVNMARWIGTQVAEALDAA